jgi:3-isopropylmalate/(R)-2-methylmalate dehydratase small subunit
MEMENKIKGKAFVLGDNVDTDQIIPAEYLVFSTSDESELKMYGRYALSAVPREKSGLPKGSIPFVNEGRYESEFKIVIAGPNFGCGSSREHAPLALQAAGVKAVIAESYARIFYRNSVDGGFIVPLETGIKLNEKIITNDMLEIDLSRNILSNLTNLDVFCLKHLGNVFEIVNAGGLFNYARSTGMIKAYK